MGFLFQEADVEYIPCSGLTGQNLKEKATESKLNQWYKGPCLVEQIGKESSIVFYIFQLYTEHPELK